MATILVEILGNATQFKKELDGAVASTAKANTGMAKMSKVAGVAGAALATGLVVGLVKSVDAAENMQQATARMDTAFARSHVSVKAFAGRIEDAETKSRKLGFTNEQVAGSLGSLVIATHSGSSALKDLAVAQDIARFKHVSLETATKTLTMAMSGSQRAVKQLGISVQKSTEFTDAATVAHKKQIDALKAQFPATNKQTAAEHELYLKQKDAIDANYAVAKAQAKVKDGHVTAAKVIATVTDKLHGQANAYSKTAAGGMAAFHAQLEAVAEKLGKVLLPALGDVAGALATGAEFFSRHTTLAKGLVIGLGALAAVLLTVSVATKLYAVGQAIATVAGGLWTGVTAAATAAQWLLNVAMDANPIGLLVIAIVGLIAAGVLLYKNSETVRSIINAVWASIKNVAMPVIDWFVDTAFPALKAAFKAVVDWFTGTAMPIFKDAFRIAGEFVGQVIDNLKGYFEGMKTSIEGVVNFFGDLFHGRWDKLWGDAKQIVSGYLDAIASLFDGIPGMLLGAIKAIAPAAIKVGEAIVSGILGGLGGLMSALITAVENAVTGALSSAVGFLTGGGAHPAVAGGHPIRVPHAATGGFVSQSGLAVIHAGETITPAGQGGGVNVTVQVMGSVIKGDELGVTVRDALIPLLRRNPSLFGSLG